MDKEKEITIKEWKYKALRNGVFMSMAYGVIKSFLKEYTALVEHTDALSFISLYVIFFFGTMCYYYFFKRQSS